MDFNYSGKYTNVISFPLGGIGTGSLGLSGTGRFIDWEIFNKPSKNSTNGYTHFAIKAMSDGELLDTRILHGDYPAHFMGDGMPKNHSWGMGHGPNRTTLSSFPHFEHVNFKGTYPIANLDFKDDMFPGHAQLKAFNPFIPMNDKDSSIPSAFYEWTIHNNTTKEITYTISFNVFNPNTEKSYNRYDITDGMSTIIMDTNQDDKEAFKYGNLTVGTTSDNVTYQEYWYRGGWFDDLATYWNNFATTEPLMNRHYDEDGSGDMCTLAVSVTIKPHESSTIPFVLGWYYPNQMNYWSTPSEEENIDNHWLNYYATLFDSSKDVVKYCLNNWDRLLQDTMLFRDALFNSSLPKEAIDAIQGNIAILKSPTVLRLENGEFYGWEGVHTDKGSCEGSCTHVWNYTYALPFLFPNLERSMRDLDYKYNLGADGDMTFRLQLPLGRRRWDFRPCVDGQMGGIMKVYRDWKISGDTEWLKQLWPSVKKSLEYAWNPNNPDKWDPDQSGIMTGRQHHTYDMELFGPNSWLSGFYLVALKSAYEMALELDDPDANMYNDIYNKGQKWLNANLFSGKYYNQLIDLSDYSILEEFSEGKCLGNNSTIDAYWNSEENQIKYQIGDGSCIDQMTGQWHANLLGLGDIFTSDNVKIALQSLYDINFKKSMRNHANPCRAYCINDEAGIVICDWDDPAKKPKIPVPYAEETMNGFEYAAACHMIHEGLIAEGEEIIKSIRDRYDGFKRNPWAEIECGNNYARSMASYSLLLTYSGFSYNMVDKMIGFNPIKKESIYSTFWSVGKGWGTFETVNNTVAFNILYGDLSIKEFKLPDYIAFKTSPTVTLTDARLAEFDYCKDTNTIVFKNTIELKRGESLYIM